MEERCCLLWCEVKVGGAQLGHLAAYPQPGQRQGRVRPRGDDKVHPRRQVLDKVGERLVDRPRLDQMVVIEDEHRVGFQVGELVEQGGQDRLDARRLRGAEQGQGSLPRARLEPVDRRNEVAPEPRRVVVCGIQGEPGNRPTARQVRGPHAQQSSLAEAGRRRD